MPPAWSSDPSRPVEGLLRDLAPQVLGVLTHRYDDFGAAEDAVQEALLAASRHWLADGVPGNPRGWLIQVAERRMIDRLRSERARRRREQLSAIRDVEPGTVADRDDTLVVLFMCCHPTLTPASAIALTLRAAGGLSTAEIANAFMVPEATMAQRISRAKQRVEASGVPFQMPSNEEWSGRLRPVLHVLYLIFNEGYASSVGSDLQRDALAGEAIRLTRTVHALLPYDAEVTGLLALMLLTDARKAARTGRDGELIPLDEQDRRLWDRRLIAEGDALITAAIAQGSVGEYQLQAAIAAIHDEAARAKDTDWPEILALYGLLERMSGNPMVSLNRAIAAGMVHGAGVGLKLLEGLDEPLKGHYRLHAVRGHLLEMDDRYDAAISNYRTAADRTTSPVERDYLTTRAARLSSELTMHNNARPARVASAARCAV